MTQFTFKSIFPVHSKNLIAQGLYQYSCETFHEFTQIEGKLTLVKIPYILIINEGENYYGFNSNLNYKQLNKIDWEEQKQRKQNYELLRLL